MKQIQTDILPVLRTMRVKETKLWSLDRIRTIRSIIYTFSLESGKVFKTKSNRQDSTISVTRIQ